jgi:hypothetical protein
MACEIVWAKNDEKHRSVNRSHALHAIEQRFVHPLWSNCSECVAKPSKYIPCLKSVVKSEYPERGKEQYLKI